MKTVFALASIISLASITAACGDSMNNPDITFNPHPKMRYELTLPFRMRRGRSIRWMDRSFTW